FRRVPVTVTGPAGDPAGSAIAVRGRVAVVELAAASGLTLLPAGRPAPLTATSYGTGELIRAALDQGCRQIILGVGGSACTDGGAGMLQALGARLAGRHGRELGPGGAALAGLHTVNLMGLDARLTRTRFVLASDVDNPLLGPQGAAAVYAPQKGASSADVAVLESALARWAGAVGLAAAGMPGAGAAGGVGYAALAVLGAARRPGIEVILELAGFRQRLQAADLVITGEGALDRQTLRGKAPAGVAAAAREAGVPVIAVCGRCDLDQETLAAAGIRRAYALTDVEPDLEKCLAQPGPLLTRLAAAIAAGIPGQASCAP
ncbi:MAG TPA: glycerate kinase, partial [Streptosporangiaceae bacterium]|nr:glycerate kinase [Streptosporangiaceae bacterium]